LVHDLVETMAVEMVEIKVVEKDSPLVLKMVDFPLD